MYKFNELYLAAYRRISTRARFEWLQCE